ncbi:MAG: hypothetical protein AAGA03_12995 [Planctomycetota bacterium]
MSNPIVLLSMLGIGMVACSLIVIMLIKRAPVCDYDDGSELSLDQNAAEADESSQASRNDRERRTVTHSASAPSRAVVYVPRVSGPSNRIGSVRLPR